MIDPRVFQISFLSILLAYGILARDFSIAMPAVVVVLAVTLAGQGVAIVLGWAKKDSLLSALISGLSILLLCRAQSVGLLACAAALAIVSKFILRVRNKHFFNPTNFGILTILLLTHRVWVSPGQWGADILLASWIGILGLVVVMKSARLDTAFFFLGAYGALLAARVFYLGQPGPVLFHQLSSGTLVIFSFFMISDPRSTPDHRVARAVFAVAVALFTYVFRFHFFDPAAPLWALLFLSPLTPLLDMLLPHQRFDWRSPHEIDSVTVRLARDE